MLADDREVRLEGVDGILVYRDFFDPKLFYCCSTRPSVARAGSTYQFSIALYDQPRNECAGMLSFVVDLKLDEATRTKAQDRLREITPGAQLVEMPWSAGTVAAAIIDGMPVFGVPSLLGDNSVALAVGLTLDQYLLLKNSGSNPQAPPISIVYSLCYEAFRQQYNYSIQFDETRFRDWVQRKTRANFLFVSFEKVETFEDLMESAVIRVVAENDTGEPPPEGFQLAFLRSLQSLLEPAPRFATPPGATGSTWLIGFGSSSVHDIQNIARRLDCNMRISGAVSRKIFIQGALNGLNDALAARPPLTLPTNNPFTQKLTVRCHAAFDAAPLIAANVRIELRGNAAELANVFNKNRSAEWPIELVHLPDNDALPRYWCESDFDDKRPTSISRAVDIRSEQAFLDVLPAEFYAYRMYSVSVADEFPWDLVQSIKLELRGPTPLAFSPRVLVLGPNARSGQISAFAPQPAKLDDVEFTATYQPRSGSSFPLDGLPVGATIYLNPLLRRMVRFEASSDFDWATWSAIGVTVTPSELPQLWADGNDSFELTRPSPSASFIYWYTDSRRLTFQRQFISANPATPSTPVVPFETADAHVTISTPKTPVFIAKLRSCT